MNLKEKILFHGSATQSVTPTFGLGDDRHDYGPANKAVKVMSTLV